MPALDWRIMPAWSIRRCETISASLGSSRKTGRKYWLSFIDPLRRTEPAALEADCFKPARPKTQIRLLIYALGQGRVGTGLSIFQPHSRGRTYLFPKAGAMVEGEFSGGLNAGTA